MKAYIHAILALSCMTQLALTEEEVYPYSIVFRIPVKQCRKVDPDWNIISKTAGIDANQDDADDGSIVSMHWDPGAWPYYKYLTSGGMETINGGLPQLANIDDHINALKKNFKTFDYHVNDSSYQVINFQKWRPIWRQNTRWDRLIYQTSSVMKILKDPKRFNLSQIKSQAALDFETSAIDFFTTTLKHVKRLKKNTHGRPGFMGYPGCYFKNNDPNNSCSENSRNDNLRLLDVFAQSRALYPVIYLPAPSQYLPHLQSEDQRNLWVRTKVLEARRVVRELALEPKPWIVPIIPIHYQHTEQFLQESDMIRLVKMPCTAGADGVILWSQSTMMATQAQCEKFRKFYHKAVLVATYHGHDCSGNARSQQKRP